MAVIQVTEDTFEQEVLAAEGRVLADFNASWCGPCKVLGPVIEELSEEYEDVKFVSIDYDEAEDLADDYDVLSIPCLVLFENGKEIDRSVGNKAKEEIAAMLEG